MLWDARDAALAARGYVDGRTESEYGRDRMLRAAVEREFIIVGEALAQLRATDPALAEQIPDVARIIGFRNVLVHGYGDVDRELVWTTATQDAEALISSITTLLGDTDA